jgi:hypothetical protein
LLLYRDKGLGFSWYVEYEGELARTYCGGATVAKALATLRHALRERDWPGIGCVRHP